MEKRISSTFFIKIPKLKNKYLGVYFYSELIDKPV